MDAPPKKKALDIDVLSFDYGRCTHIGKRQHNQDEMLVPSAPGTLNGYGKFFAVADGMGGHPGGAIASQMACDRLSVIYKRDIQMRGRQKPVDISRRLVEAVIRIDRAIRLRGLSDRRFEDMGTTLSGLVITGTHSVIIHVGDSRIYRLRNGRLSCLTVDHTFVQDMIFEGEVDPKRAQFHPLSHMLTRVVGTGEPLEWVDTRVDGIKAGDCYLLCTDGLTNAIDDRDILDSLARQYFATDMAVELVARALKNGARDNITAIVVKL
jgi:protein phosphatase